MVFEVVMQCWIGFVFFVLNNKQNSWLIFFSRVLVDSRTVIEVSVPRHRLSTYGRRTFAGAGLTVWNSLPEDMRDPEVSGDSYRQSLYENALYKSTSDIWHFKVIQGHWSLTLDDLECQMSNVDSYSAFLLKKNLYK